jgi:hypothetical protein
MLPSRTDISTRTAVKRIIDYFYAIRITEFLTNGAFTITAATRGPIPCTYHITITTVIRISLQIYACAIAVFQSGRAALSIAAVLPMGTDSSAAPAVRVVSGFIRTSGRTGRVWACFVRIATGALVAVLPTSTCIPTPSAVIPVVRNIDTSHAAGNFMEDKAFQWTYKVTYNFKSLA